MKSANQTSTATRLLLAFIVLSVIVRVGSALYQGSAINPLPGVTDQISYHELALRVVKGHGFSFDRGWWPATRANEPTAHWSYLYVLFLAGIYWLFGPEPLIARVVQAVLVGILHPLLAWRIGGRLFNPTIGLVSTALTSIYGYFVFYAGALVTESFYFLAFLWVLDLSTGLPSALTRERRRSVTPWIVLGLSLAVGTLLRQAFLLMVPVVLTWIAWQLSWRRERGSAIMAARTLAPRLALAVAVLLLCVAPWTVRNYRAFGQFVLLNTNAGFVFFWGNHPIHGTEFIPILPSGPVDYGTLLPRELSALNEGQLDRALFLRGLGFVEDDPIRYVRLSISRANEYFKFWPSADSSLASNYTRVLSFGFLAPFLVFGILLTLAGQRDGRWCGSRGTSLLLIVAALYSLVHLLTWTLVRYRLPVDAITMPFAALSQVAVFQRIRSLMQVSQVLFRDAQN